MKYILLVITIISCLYAIYCTYQKNIYEQAIIMIVLSVYKPKTIEECARTIEEILNELDRPQE